MAQCSAYMIGTCRGISQGSTRSFIWLCMKVYCHAHRDIAHQTALKSSLALANLVLRLGTLNEAWSTTVAMPAKSSASFALYCRIQLRHTLSSQFHPFPSAVGTIDEPFADAVDLDWGCSSEELTSQQMNGMRCKPKMPKNPRCKV